MNAFHLLASHRQRVSEAYRIALATGHTTLANECAGVAKRLNGMAAMYRPADEAFLSGQIGGNGMAEQIDDIEWRARRAQQFSSGAASPRNAGEAVASPFATASTLSKRKAA